MRRPQESPRIYSPILSLPLRSLAPDTRSPLLPLACRRVFETALDAPPCRTPAGEVFAEERKARARQSDGLRRRLRCVEAGRPQRGGLASPTRVRLWAAASGRVGSRVMGGGRVGRVWAGPRPALGSGSLLVLSQTHQVDGRGSVALSVKHSNQLQLKL